MSKVIPRQKIPPMLRLLCAVMLLLGLVGIVLWISRFFQGQSPRMSRLVTSAISVYGGYQVLRGHRDGLDSLLFGFALGSLIIPYLLFFADDPPSWAWPVAAWIVIGGGYLLYCRITLPWVDEDEIDDLFDDEDEDHDAVLADDLESPPDAHDLIGDLIDDESSSSLALVRLQQLAEQPEHRSNVANAVTMALADHDWSDALDSAEGLVELLPDPPPPEAARGLAALVAADARAQSKASARSKDPTLGDNPFDGIPTGQDRAWNLLAQLAPSDYESLLFENLDTVRVSYVITAGLVLAIEQGRASSAFKERLQPKLFELLDAPAAEPAAEALALLAPRELVTTLSAPLPKGDYRAAAFVGARNRGVELPATTHAEFFDQAVAERAWPYVRALTATTITEARLSAALDELSTDELGEALEQHEAELAIEALARELVLRGSPTVEERLRQLTTHANGRIRVVASAQLCALVGLSDWPRFDEDSELSPLALACSATRLLIDMSRDAGLLVSVTTMSAEQFAVIEPTLEAMECPDALRIWRATQEALGGHPMPTDRDERMERMADHIGDAYDRIEELDLEFGEIDDDLETRLNLLMAANADELRPFLDA